MMVATDGALMMPSENRIRRVWHVVEGQGFLSSVIRLDDSSETTDLLASFIMLVADDPLRWQRIPGTPHHYIASCRQASANPLRMCRPLILYFAIDLARRTVTLDTVREYEDLREELASGRARPSV